MRIPCPEGWTATRKETIKGVTLTVQHTTVQIYGGVCDSCVLCGIATCRFYDTSATATRRFQRAQGEEHTLDHLRKRLNPH